MPRISKIFANVENGRVYNGETAAELNTSSFPYISSKEKPQLQIQYVTDLVDVNTFTPYTGFVGQTITSSAVIDNDYNKFDSGTLAVALSAGAITEIEVEISSLDNTPQPTGLIRLINAGGQSDTVNYTQVVISGDNYLFTVSQTLTYSYSIGATAETNDPPLIKTTTVDQTNKDTGLFIFSLDANSQPYLLEIEGESQIQGCIFEHQAKDGGGDLIFNFAFTFIAKNTLDDDGALPPPQGFNFYTKTESDARYLPKDGSSVDLGTLLISTDEVIAYDATTGLAKKRPVSEIALGSGVPPVQNEYIDIAAMLADQINQTTDYFQQVGTGKDTELYKKTATTTASITDYDEITKEPIQNSYADTIAMIADQANQTASYIQNAGTDYYEYLGTTVGDITDYKALGSGAVSTDDLGLDTGVIYGLVPTINVDPTKIDISAGAIFIRDYMTDPQNPTYKKCIYDGETAITITNLATDTFTQLVAVEDLPSNAGKVRIEQIGGQEQDVQYYKDKVKLQVAFHVDNTAVTFFSDDKQLAYNKINDLVKYTVANGAVVRGVEIKDNGSNDLSCTQAAGTAQAVDINSANSIRDNSEKSFIEKQASLFYNYRTTGDQFVYEANASSVIKPNLWNNLTTNTLDAVPAGKFTIQRVFFFPISNTTGVAYGQNLYDSQSEAIENLQNGFVKAEFFERAVLITAMICKSGATSTQNIADVLFAQSRQNTFDTGLTNISIRPGFLNIEDSELTYDNATRTLTLSPIAPATTVKVRLFNGAVLEQSSFSWTNTNVEGLHYFYLDDDGVEQVATGINRETIFNFLGSTISTAFVDWGNASFLKANIVTDFRKSASGMSPQTTRKNFFDIQIYSLDGTNVTDFPSAPDGTVNTDAQFGFATDQLTVGDRDFNFPAFTRGDTWRVIYKDGANTRHIDKTGYAFLTGADFALGTDYPVYNNNGTPSFANPPNANSPRYVYYLHSIINDIEPTRRMVAWMGNSVYTSEALASEDLANEVARVESLTGIKQQSRVVYAVLYEIDLDYTNTYKTVAKSITAITRDTGQGGSTSIPSNLVDGTNADNLHKHELQALQASTSAINDDANTTYRADGSGVVEKVKNNLVATVDPTATDDSASGYTIDSTWINVTTDKFFKCVDSTATSAVWLDLSQSGGGSSNYPWIPSSTISQTGNYTILVANVDKKHLLTSSATADSTFTFPTTSLVDGMTIPLLNDSNFKLIPNNGTDDLTPVWKGDGVVTYYYDADTGAWL